MAHHLRRRHHLATDQVVGEIKEPADEGAIAGDSLRQPCLSIGRTSGPLHHKAALGADRHDDCVLDHLGLDEAEYLCTEILAPVRPSETTARYWAEPEVYAFDPRRVHPDLIARSGRGQVGYGPRVKLDREVGFRPPGGVPLEVVGAQRRLDDS